MITQHSEIIDVENIGRIIVDSSKKVHEALGPGLLVPAYRKCLAHELRQRSFEALERMPVLIAYEGIEFDGGARPDVIVNRKVVVTVRANESISPQDCLQMMSFLRVLRLDVGLLVNFNELDLDDGIHMITSEDIDTMRKRKANPAPLPHSKPFHLWFVD